MPDDRSEPSDPAREVAERSAQVMLEGDQAARLLGIRLTEVTPGRAVLEMTVRDDMLNGWGSCHGGLVATLADSAFAVACNSFGEVTVAAGFDVVFLAPARVGDVLVATAEKRSGAGRSGIYDATVVRLDDGGGAATIAEFRGRSRSLGQPVERGFSV